MPSFSFYIESSQLKHGVKKSWKRNLGEKGIKVPACSKHFIGAGFYPINSLFLNCLILAD